MTTVSMTVVCRRLAVAGLLFFTPAWSAAAQGIVVAQRLDVFDAYMAKTLKDWNAPGVAVGIVVNDKLVFAKGYGFRDYEKKLPFTPATMSPIASNTKLFTAVAAGMLVEEGKLSWDKPVRESVPAIRFYNDQLNNTVTLLTGSCVEEHARMHSPCSGLPHWDGSQTRSIGKPNRARTELLGAPSPSDNFFRR